jgi:hypothetical protein
MPMTQQDQKNNEELKWPSEAVHKHERVAKDDGVNSTPKKPPSERSDHPE